MTPEGFEPPAFGFGIQRAAVAPWSLLLVNRFGCATFPAGSAWLGPQRIGCKQSPFKPKEQE